MSFDINVKLMNSSKEKKITIQLPVYSIKKLTDEWKNDGWYSNYPCDNAGVERTFGDNLTLPEINRLLKCLIKNSKRLDVDPNVLLDSLVNRFPMIEDHYYYRVNVKKTCNSLNRLLWDSNSNTPIIVRLIK